MRQYATEVEYTTVTGDASPPANIVSLLTTASQVVDECLRGFVYETDPNGYPTDPDHLLAVRDACAWIAGEAIATGVLAAGSTQQWESVAIGSVQLSTLQGASSSDSPQVLGVPVPSAARLALAVFGRPTVYLC